MIGASAIHADAQDIVQPADPLPRAYGLIRAVMDAHVTGSSIVEGPRLWEAADRVLRHLLSRQGSANEEV